jgi:hypothetical protein
MKSDTTGCWVGELYYADPLGLCNTVQLHTVLKRGMAAFLEPLGAQNVETHAAEAAHEFLEDYRFELERSSKFEQRLRSIHQIADWLFLNEGRTFPANALERLLRSALAGENCHEEAKRLLDPKSSA